ncbi:MAG TPA: DinB family protein [Candidatus Limnocylindria bacterium]|jgi:uncharacterized damage-inducible protein DinB|nr:DinB family protein [Candidatus Limnocylindria bacterium]
MSDQQPTTVRETLRLMDESFDTFSAAAARLSAEEMNERLGEEAWTRKQMLNHVATWHDLATDRLIAFGASGKPIDLDEEDDAVNARAARVAEGKTAGEVLDAVSASYRRLRRHVANLADRQLAAADGWPAGIIAGNTYEHYAAHAADVQGAEGGDPALSSP